MDAGADAKSAIKKQKDMDERTNTSKDTIREAADAKMVNEAFEELLKSYLSSPHRKKVDLITKAFNFARQAHKGVRRLSGEPYIIPPNSKVTDWISPMASWKTVWSRQSSGTAVKRVEI